MRPVLKPSVEAVISGSPQSYELCGERRSDKTSALFAIRRKRASDVCSNDREPSQQRRAPRGDPGRGEIPMRPKARPVDVFPKINNLLFGDIENKYERKND